MALTYIPSLSENGWVSDTDKLLDLVVSYYVLTDAAQTVVYQGNIKNLPETYYRYINDPTGFRRGIVSDLETLLSRYFSQVDVIARVKDLGDNKYAIVISVGVIGSDGKKSELNRLIKYSSTKLHEIVRLNNIGEGVRALESL